MQVKRIVAVIVCLCPLASAQTDAGLWRFVHPNAKALIGIDVQRIRTSRVAEEMTKQLHALPFPVALPMKFPAMDLIQSIDRVILSSPGRSALAPDAEPSLLIAVSGHFEPNKLNQMFQKAGARRQVYNGITIYRLQDQQNSEFGFVVLNSQTMLIGDAKSLFTIIDRIGKGTAAPPPIVERARDMDVAYDFWAVLSTPPSAMASERFPMMDFTDKLTGLQVGIAVRDGLALDINLNAMTEKAAKDMADQLSKLLRLASKDRENHPEWTGLDRKTKVRIEKADVHIALRLDNKEVGRLAKSFDESRSRRQALTAAATTQPPVAPASEQSMPVVKQPEAKKVIRIEGLDEGPREIPYRPSGGR